MEYTLSYLLKTFLQRNNIEFTVNLQGDIKVLFTFFDDIHIQHKKIYAFLQKNDEYFLHHKRELDFVFELAQKHMLPLHISFDLQKQVSRIYLGMYFLDMYCAQNILGTIEERIHGSRKYEFESNFFKIDCVGFNIKSKIEMKVYELLDNEDKKYLPKNILPKYIKEQGVLKDLHGRKKRFFRFFKPLDLIVFGELFPKEIFDLIEKEVSEFYTLQRQVKYYCCEGNGQEIYYI